MEGAMSNLYKLLALLLVDHMPMAVLCFDIRQWYKHIALPWSSCQVLAYFCTALLDMVAEWKCGNACPRLG